MFCLTFFVGVLVPLAEFCGIRHEYFSNVLVGHFASWATLLCRRILSSHRFVHFNMGPLSRPFIWVGIYVIATFAMYVLTLHANGWYAGGIESEYRNFIAPRSPVCVIQVLSVFFCLSGRWSHGYQTSGLAKRYWKRFRLQEGIYLIQIPIINYISVKYDRCLRMVKRRWFIRGLFVFIVAALWRWSLQGPENLKRCVTSCTKSW